MHNTQDLPGKQPDSPRIIDCPSCGTKVAWVQESTFRPFCSERCKLIDFGDWAAEKNTIPVKDGPDNMSFPSDDYEG
jgi:endogenous inhibitor of DNA gyrase (YacG/DUF329 family)